MLQIDLYTGITCPWCFVGQHRLDKVLKERFPGVAPDIHHHPVLLMQDAPEAGVFIPELLRMRYGITEPGWCLPGLKRRPAHQELNLDRQLYAYPIQAANAVIMDAG